MRHLYKKLFILFLFTPLGSVNQIFSQSLISEANIENKKIIQLADDYLVAWYAHDPDMMSDQNIENAQYDIFTDRSLSAIYKFQEYQDSVLEKLKDIDSTQLINENRTLYHVFMDFLQSKKKTRICKNELWGINTIFPWFSSFVDFAENQPVGNEKARQDAIKRWSQFSVVVDDEIDKLKLGLQLGYTVPKTVLPRIINQLDTLLSSPIESSSFFVPGNRDFDENFRAQFSKLMVDVIYPGLLKYKNFLTDEYLPNTRDAIGVINIPNGKQCYQAMITESTTKDISPEDIHAIGIQAVSELENQLAEISKKYFNGISTQELIKLARERPYPFETEQLLIDYNLKALDRINSILPKLMTVRPKSSFEIRPYPPYLAKAGAIGEYHAPTKDGTKPGIFYINTMDYQTVGYADIEGTLFHEAIPGHHLQISLLVENDKLHPLGALLGNSASIEGWGLYAEKLAAEFNLYSTPLSEVGHIANVLLRAARLVVDTGLQVYSWSKEQATSYIRNYSTLPEAQIHSEIDRYITYVGQATSYYIGLKEILDARQYAKSALGDEFSLPKFHDHLLTLGIVPANYMQNSVKEWVSQQQQQQQQVKCE